MVYQWGGGGETSFRDGEGGCCAGLGKTTLAHVVARHCGYRTVEINASDERTATTLHARISDAVQMQSVMGAGRPNCVIIDEIDGATGAPLLYLSCRSECCSCSYDVCGDHACERCWLGRATHCSSCAGIPAMVSDVGLCVTSAGGTEGRGAIQALLKLVQAGNGKGGGGGGSAAEEAEEAGAENAAEGKQGRRRKKGAQPLCRPLIAVCNDLYAPALRPLRAVAKIVHYKKPTACSLICSSILLCFLHDQHASIQLHA